MRAFVLLILSMLFAACDSAPRSDIACGEPAGIPAGRLLLLGEMHGSVESPALTGRIACSRSKTGPTALGLEIPVAEQAPINVYLQSNGDTEARQALLSGPFWQKVKDGRSSHAMLTLVELARQLRQQGLPLSVFAFDAQTDIQSDRNAVLAGAIREYSLKNPKEAIVALMGNRHAGKSPFYVAGKTIDPTGKLLEDLSPISVNLSYSTGSIWACMPECTTHNLDAGRARQPVGVFVQDPYSEDFNYTYVISTLTASLPATDAGNDG